MREFLLFFWDARGGIFVLIVLFAAVVFGIRYLAWIFQWGRFASAASQTTGSPGVKGDGKLAFVIADFFVKLINDFRHLLALILVSIFAGVLLFAIWRSQQTIDDIGKAVQSVTSALGGLIGSIIGYYFGESAGKRSDSAQATVSSSAPPIQSSAVNAFDSSLMPAPSPTPTPDP